MDAIGPGDWVECVNIGDVPGSAGNVWCPDDRLQLGAVYRISDLWVNRARHPVVLVGWERPEASIRFGYRCGYHVARFRPLKSDITSLEKLLTEPVPSELEAV